MAFPSFLGTACSQRLATKTAGIASICPFSSQRGTGPTWLSMRYDKSEPQYKSNAGSRRTKYLIY